MGRDLLLVGVTLLVISTGGVSSAPAASPARMVTAFFSKTMSPLAKRLWSLKATAKKVETVFDGSKLGIEPYSVELLPKRELLILDSANSNIHRISSSLSPYSKPKLVAGSAEGCFGHIDGKLREARMNQPKGFTVDDKGNIYVADTMNMAIRKISDSGITTMAGGKGGRAGGHVDGPSEEAKFSNDFDVVYVGSSCSLLIIDRGNRAIREIPLHFDDCAYQYGSGFPLGIAMLIGAGFFGYMLALLQSRVGAIMSSENDHNPITAGVTQSTPCQMPLKSVRPPLIQTEDEQDNKLEEGVFGSFVKLIVNTGASMMEIVGGVLPSCFRKKSVIPDSWPAQESFLILDEDEPPAIDTTRAPTPRKTYAFMSNPEKIHQLQRSRTFFSGWDGDSYQPLQQHQQQQQPKHAHHQHQYQSSTPHTYYEQSHEKTVFGAVQEQVGRPDGLKPVKDSDRVYGDHKIRSRSIRRFTLTNIDHATVRKF